MSDTTTSKPKGLQPYIIQEWVNGENTNTPISAERLTHMEVGIGDLSKALLDGREPAYTVTSETAPVPSTPCLLVVVDDTGLYKGTWRDDGKTRIQVGWGPDGDQERYAFTPTAGSHDHDWATLTRHGVMVELSGYYTPSDKEKNPDYQIYLTWIKIPVSCLPPHTIYSLDVVRDLGSQGAANTYRDDWLPRLRIEYNTGYVTPELWGTRSDIKSITFHAVWMTDAAPLPASVLKSAMPEAAPTAQAPAPAAPAAAAQQASPQAPAEHASATQATQAQEQTPAAQPTASQASAGQEQASPQAPAQASPAHAAPEQAKDVQAPAVQDAPAPAASTARHAKQELEE